MLIVVISKIFVCTFVGFFLLFLFVTPFAVQGDNKEQRMKSMLRVCFVLLGLVLIASTLLVLKYESGEIDNNEYAKYQEHKENILRVNQQAKLPLDQIKDTFQEIEANKMVSNFEFHKVLNMYVDARMIEFDMQKNQQKKESEFLAKQIKSGFKP